MSALTKETRRWVLNVWGDHIPCRTQDELEREIHAALEEGATEMSIERKDEESLAPTNHVAENRGKEYDREAAQDEGCKESTVEGAARALEIMLSAYSPNDPKLSENDYE